MLICSASEQLPEPLVAHPDPNIMHVVLKGVGPASFKQGPLAAACTPLPLHGPRHGMRQGAAPT